MVSPDFLASDFVHCVELPDLLQAAENEHATIMWVPIGYALVNSTRIKCKNGKEICINDYQAVCDPKKPLQEMSVPERAKTYIKLCENIKYCFGIT